MDRRICDILRVAQTFEAYAYHNEFSLSSCNLNAGNEKGSVENIVIVFRQLTRKNCACWSPIGCSELCCFLLCPRNYILSTIRNSWTESEIGTAIDDYSGSILVYLNEYLYAKEMGDVFSLSSKYDIEHITPSSGNSLQVIRRDAGIQSEDVFSNIVNKLGNKILLEEKINRSIGNEWFSTKVPTTLENKTGYIDSKYPIAKALVSKYQDKSKS